MLGVIATTRRLVEQLNDQYAGKLIKVNGWSDLVEVDHFTLDEDKELNLDRVLIIMRSGEIIEYFTLPKYTNHETNN